MASGVGGTAGSVAASWLKGLVCSHVPHVPMFSPGVSSGFQIVCVCVCFAEMEWPLITGVFLPCIHIHYHSDQDTFSFLL